MTAIRAWHCERPTNGIYCHSPPIHNPLSSIEIPKHINYVIYWHANFNPKKRPYVGDRHESFTLNLEIAAVRIISVTFSHRMSSDASREINCFSLFGGCEIIAHEEEDTWSRVEGWWAPSGRDARNHGSVGGAALGCGVSGQEEEEVVSRRVLR